MRVTVVVVVTVLFPVIDDSRQVDVDLYVSEVDGGYGIVLDARIPLAPAVDASSRLTRFAEVRAY